MVLFSKKIPRGSVYAILNSIFRLLQAFQFRQALQSLAALVAAAALFFDFGDGLQPPPPWWARYGLRLGAEDVPA
jgi:hypothetical protein